MPTLEEICPELAEWPDRWMGVPRDKVYGRQLLEAMRPFMVHLLESGRSRKTIRRHMDNLWLLGGEVIRDVGSSNAYSTPAARKLRESVDLEGGPYCRHLGTETEQAAFDATCRKLHRFLQSRVGER